MNREDTINLARKSKLDIYGLGCPHDKFIECVDRFADLIISHKLDEMASKVEQDFKGAFGADTCASWASWIKESKMNTQPTALRLADALRDGTYLLSVERDETEAELRRLHIIEEAVKNLVKVKGRYHTEQAFNALKELVK